MEFRNSKFMTTSAMNNSNWSLNPKQQIVAGYLFQRHILDSMVYLKLLGNLSCIEFVLQKAFISTLSQALGISSHFIIQVGNSVNVKLSAFPIHLKRTAASGGNSLKVSLFRLPQVIFGKFRCSQRLSRGTSSDSKIYLETVFCKMFNVFLLSQHK